ncbi:uncharacterized protein TNCV_1616991 [Trichonephila clavipes]|nr:uncharacterized protein TNCV_1616991 [Trichonephila clavipes]
MRAIYYGVQKVYKIIERGSVRDLSMMSNVVAQHGRKKRTSHTEYYAVTCLGNNCYIHISAKVLELEFTTSRSEDISLKLSGIENSAILPAAAFAYLFGGKSVLSSWRVNSCQVIYSQFGLAIHQNDHQARGRFVEWAQNEIAVVPDFHKRIFFSDEAHFWLNGYVNKQNFRIWSEANPQVYVETPLHPEKLTVWCALWAGGILLQKR